MVSTPWTEIMSASSASNALWAFPCPASPRLVRALSGDAHRIKGDENEFASWPVSLPGAASGPSGR